MDNIFDFGGFFNDLRIDNFTWDRLYKPDEFRWDPRTLGWDYRLPLYASTAYLVTIFALKVLMMFRKPFELKAAYAIHNGLLSAFSLAIFVGQSYETYQAYKKMGGYSLFCWQSSSPPDGSLFFWSYLFYLSKYWEYLDTVFMVLKKKPLDFLHCYHHAIVPIMARLGFMGWYMPIITGCLFNSLVHVIMYYYYMMVTLKIRVWWKKYLTVFQIVQFCSGGVFTACFYYLYFQDIRISENDGNYFLSFQKGCFGDLFTVISTALVNISFLLLFCQFYTKTYTSTKSSDPNRFLCGVTNMQQTNGKQKDE